MLNYLTSDTNFIRNWNIQHTSETKKDIILYYYPWLYDHWCQHHFTSWNLASDIMDIYGGIVCVVGSTVLYCCFFRCKTSELIQPLMFSIRNNPWEKGACTVLCYTIHWPKSPLLIWGTQLWSTHHSFRFVQWHLPAIHIRPT